MIEFGINVGRTAKAMLANVPTLKSYHGVDVPIGYIPAMPVQRNEVPAVPGELVLADPRFQLLVRPRGSFDLRIEDFEPCDAVFIDGDHGRDGVLHDTALADAVVRPGGIIIWHDYHTLGTVDVADVLHELADTGRPIKHVRDTWIAFERKPASQTAQ